MFELSPRLSRRTHEATMHSRILILLTSRKFLIRDFLVLREFLVALIVAGVADIDNPGVLVRVSVNQLAVELSLLNLIGRQGSVVRPLLSGPWGNGAKARSRQHGFRMAAAAGGAPTQSQAKNG